MNGPGIPNPLEAAYSRRNFLRFGVAATVIATAAIVENKFHIISDLTGGNNGIGHENADQAPQPTTEPITTPATIEASTTLPVQTTESTSADYDTTTSSSSSTTTSTTEPATTTTVETLPPGPEYLKVPQAYAPGEMIGQISITNPGELKPIISGSLYETDDPNKPRIPLPKGPNDEAPDYLTPYLDNGPGHNGGTAFPGQKGNCVVPMHRTTHGAPGRRINEVKTGAIITFTYTNPQTNPELLGVTCSYRVIGEPFSVLEADASAAISEQDPEMEAIITAYACEPPGSAKERMFVKAVRIQPDQLTA